MHQGVRAVLSHPRLVLLEDRGILKPIRYLKRAFLPVNHEKRYSVTAESVGTPVTEVGIFQRAKSLTR